MALILYSFLTNGGELPYVENSPRQNVCCHCHNTLIDFTWTHENNNNALSFINSFHYSDP